MAITPERARRLCLATRCSFRANWLSLKLLLGRCAYASRWFC